MVGIGGRTHVKRCHMCRKKKIKCDAESPACRRCTNAGISCPGYQKKLEIIFDAQMNSQNKTPEKTGDKPIHGLVRSRSPERVLRQVDEIIINNAYLYSTFNFSARTFQVQTALIDLIQRHYIPGDNWITNVCSFASKSSCQDIICDLLVSMSLSLVSQLEGQKPGKNDYEFVALKFYSRSVKQLREALFTGIEKLDDQQLDIYFIACILCGMYEMIANRSYLKLTKHLDGCGAILKYRGPENLISKTSRRTFYEYRSIRFSLDLMSRNYSFLSKNEWINPSWKASEKLSATWLHTCIDIGLMIPPLITEFDRMKKASLSIGSVQSVQKILLKKALSVQQSLNAWNARLYQTFEQSLFPLERPSYRSGTKIFDDALSPACKSYLFPSWDVASSFLYQAMIRIALNHLLIELKRLDPEGIENSKIKSSQSVNFHELHELSMKSADDICKSTEYFLSDNRPQFGRSIVLGPYEMAIDFYAYFEKICSPDKYPEVQKKLAFCCFVRSLIRSSSPLPLWEQSFSFSSN